MTSRLVFLSAALAVVLSLTLEASGATVTKMHPFFKDAGTKDGLQIWRVENFEPKPVPVADYGKFYSGDSYIVLNTREDKGKKGTFTWDIHFWLGDKTSQDESGAAAILAVELDDALGGSPVQHREVQDHESQQFLKYFKNGVRYVPGGIASGFHHAEINAPGEKKFYQVKGKKNIRVRQVEINVKSMNKGDCFILDAGREIYVYVGSKAKGTERLKAISAANQIRDQDHAGRAHVTIVDDSSTQVEVDKFFSELGSGSQSAVPDEATGGDDQDFEKTQETTVALYKVTDAGGKLVSEKVGQKPLQQSMLNTEDCFVLDTVTSGIYVWIGKKSTTQEKVESLKKGQAFLTSKNYPAWTKMRRVVEMAEPTIFKEYFTNWRDGQVIGGIGRGVGNVEPLSRGERDIVSGRCGVATAFMPDDGTGQAQVFRVEDFELTPIPDNTFGFFFGGDSYVIKYQYDTRGQTKYIIYFWQGKESSTDEKAAAALHALRLDNELHGRALQIRVMQGEEPAHFLRIFKGKMVVFMGGRASGFRNIRDHDTYDVDGTRLFQIIGTCENDVRAIQVPEIASSLNGDDVFLLETPLYSYLWVGLGCTSEERSMAWTLRSRICPDRESVIVTEGEEPGEFWEALGGHNEYGKETQVPEHHIFHHPDNHQHQRHAYLFHCYFSPSHKLVVDEITDFQQKDLFPDDIMILDSGEELYLWIGKDADHEERSHALKMAENYLYQRHRKGKSIILKVRQGEEPDSFTRFFGDWEDDYWDSLQSYDDFKNGILEKNKDISFD